MEIWCDSADLNEMSAIIEGGWIQGITTNPKILSSQPLPASGQIASLLDAQSGRVAVQVTATTEHEMLTQAKRLYALSERVLVKIPMTPMGINALAKLKILSIPTLATAVFGADQFCLAAKLGAEYVAPYCHQMSQQDIDPIAEITFMQEMIKHYGFKTKVMAASIQDPCMIKKLASLGVASITLTPACLIKWCENAFTIASTKSLNEAWAPFAKQYAGMLFHEEENEHH